MKLFKLTMIIIIQLFLLLSTAWSGSLNQRKFGSLVLTDDKNWSYIELRHSFQNYTEFLEHKFVPGLKGYTSSNLNFIRKKKFSLDSTLKEACDENQRNYIQKYKAHEYSIKFIKGKTSICNILTKKAGHYTRQIYFLSQRKESIKNIYHNNFITFYYQKKQEAIANQKIDELIKSFQEVK